MPRPSAPSASVRVPAATSSTPVDVVVEARLGVNLARTAEGYLVVEGFKRDAGNEIGDVQSSGLVAVGDALLAVDGSSVEMLSMDALTRSLKRRPVTLTFARPMVRHAVESSIDHESVSPSPGTPNEDDPESRPLKQQLPAPPTRDPLPATYTARDFEIVRPWWTRRRVALGLMALLAAFLLWYALLAEDAELEVAEPAAAVTDSSPGR